MNEENRITLILIDTCAFRDANSDFPGIAKSLLPSFFSTADEKGITLLTHPVLENEIHKHIEDSGIFKDYQSLLTQLRKCTSTLKHYKLDDVLYFYMAYADIDFTDAEAEVDCEILISFDFDDPENTAQVMEFHLLNQGNICIDCEGASIREIDEEELSVRVLREDKGYPRRNTK